MNREAEMIEKLAINKKALENELRDRIQAFFKANDEAPASVSIKMQLSGLGHDNHLSTIDIHVKDAARN